MVPRIALWVGRSKGIHICIKPKFSKKKKKSNENPGGFEDLDSGVSWLVTSCVGEVVTNSLSCERTKNISVVHDSLSCLFLIT